MPRPLQLDLVRPRQPRCFNAELPWLSRAFKKRRETAHTHNPVDDARGNADVDVRGRLEARVLRAPFYELVEWAEPKEGKLGVSSGGVWLGVRWRLSCAILFPAGAPHRLLPPPLVQAACDRASSVYRHEAAPRPVGP